MVYCCIWHVDANRAHRVGPVRDDCGLIASGHGLPCWAEQPFINH